MNDLRETPSSIGRPNFVKLSSPASNCKLCSSVFPKPDANVQYYLVSGHSGCRSIVPAVR